MSGMDCCLALLLSSLLALFSVGAGASLSLATVKSKVREQALSMVGRIRKHNDQLWLTSPNLVAEELDSAAPAEQPQDLSSFLDVLGGYQLKLQTMPQLWVVQLREDTSTLRSWLEKWMLMLCPGRLQRPMIGQGTTVDDPLARFDESWSRVELKKMEGVLSHLLRALHRLRTC